MGRRERRRFDKTRVHRNADFENIHGESWRAELFDRPRDNVGLDAREVRAFFIHLIVIADNFEKKGNVRGETFGADTLDPVVFPGVDFL